MALSPSRRDTIGPPPRDVTDLARIVRHQGSYLRSLDPGLLEGRFATPRPVPHGGSQLVGDDGGGDGGEDLAAWDTDQVVATVAGQVTLHLTYEPIENTLLVFHEGDRLLPSEWTVDGQIVTYLDPHIHVGDIISTYYWYFPTDPAAPDPGAWYRFNEASGALMADSSGNAHDGTYTAVTLGQPSLMLSDADPAAYWNGTTSHAEVFYDAWMDSPAISGTILCKGAGAGTLIGRDDGSIARLWDLRIGSSFGGAGGQLSFVFGGIFLQPVITVPGTNLGDGNRHMPGFSYDGATLKLYLDGVPVLTQSVAATFTAPNVSLTFGASRSGGGGSFVDNYAGTLDEARIYPQVLEDSDFADLWAAS